MKHRETVAQRRLRLEMAMKPLVGLPQFEDFMDTIEELKEGAVDAAISFDSVGSTRNSTCALGEVRAYKEIIAQYHSAREQLESLRQQEAPTTD